MLRAALRNFTLQVTWLYSGLEIEDINVDCRKIKKKKKNKEAFYF